MQLKLLTTAVTRALQPHTLGYARVLTFLKATQTTVCVLCSPEQIHCVEQCVLWHIQAVDQ
jgi:hypothetical protein